MTSLLSSSSLVVASVLLVGEIVTSVRSQNLQSMYDDYLSYQDPELQEGEAETMSSSNLMESQPRKYFMSGFPRSIAFPFMGRSANLAPPETTTECVPPENENVKPGTVTPDTTRCEVAPITVTEAETSDTIRRSEGEQFAGSDSGTASTPQASQAPQPSSTTTMPPEPSTVTNPPAAASGAATAIELNAAGVATIAPNNMAGNPGNSAGNSAPGNVVPNNVVTTVYTSAPPLFNQASNSAASSFTFDGSKTGGTEGSNASSELEEKSRELRNLVQHLYIAQARVQLEANEIKKAEAVATAAQQTLEEAAYRVRAVTAALQNAQRDVAASAIRAQTAQLQLAAHDQLLFAARQDVDALSAQMVGLQAAEGVMPPKITFDISEFMDKLKQPLPEAEKPTAVPRILPMPSPLPPTPQRKNRNNNARLNVVQDFLYYD